MRRLVWATVLCGLLATLGAPAQGLPDFSGAWDLQRDRSGTPTDVWGQTRARRLRITQSASELALESEGGGLSGSTALQRFRLDGSAVEVVDDSLGDLGAFTRKVRTEARWRDGRLTLLYEPFGVTVEGGVSRRVAGSITSTWTLWLVGDDLHIERSGFRMQPPPLLHGRPYPRAEDLVYNRDVTVYVRSR